MAQAALQEEQIPEGGIADFVMSDEEIAALEKEEAKEQFGDTGIANFQEVASRMASYGRFGDDRLAHVETGELLVPRALIENNPKLKESIFNHLREMGIEDPDRYVVGSGANSINPDTGLPEFFLKKVFSGVRKAVSSVAKGVSKAISSVGKVLKKVAPVVLPIALAMTPLGPIYGAALGSGIGTLVQGGDLKDALKSALISGASGAVFSGISSKLGGGTFTGGVKAAATDPLGRLAQTGTGLKEAVTGQGFGTLSGGYQAPVEGAGIPEGTDMDRLIGREGTTPADVQARATDITSDQTFAQPDYSPAGKTPLNDPNVARVNDPYFQDASGAFDPTGRNVMGYRYEGISGTPDGTGYDYRFGGTGGPTPERVASFAGETTTTSAQPGFFDQVKSYASEAKDFAGDLYSEYLSPSRGAPSTADLAAEAGKIQAEYAAQGVQLTGQQASEMAAKNLAPGLISSYAPLAAAGGALAYGAGFFDAAPQEDPNLVDRRTGADLIAEDPEQYMVAGRTPQYATGPTTVATRYGLPSGGAMFRNPFLRPQMFAAEGGEVYPRRNGGIMPNEGIPDQDSVRALLMPGEFVMTKDAVRGLGNGNLNQGINNMYSMMRNLEAKGQVA